MPCVCGQKVDRPQPKVQCAECQEFFHLDCVGLLQADVDFLLSSDKPYICKTCSADRRSSIRCQTLSVLSAETKSKEHDDTNVHNNKQQITLLVVVNEIAALRTENSRILSAVNALREEKKQIMQKSDDLLAEIRSLHFKLEAKDVALSTLTTEVKNLKSIVVNSASILGSGNPKHASSLLSPLSVRCPPIDHENNALNSAATSKPASQTSALHGSAVAKEKKAKSTSKTAAATTPAPAKVTFASVAASSQVSATSVLNAAAESVPAMRQTSQWEMATKSSRRKFNKPIVIGSNNNNELQVVPIFKWLHLSSFSPNVKETDILTYVSKHAEIETKSLVCYKLVKKDTELNTLRKINFKLGVSECSFEKVLNADIWPECVKIRPFHFFQKNDSPIHLQ